MTAGECFVVAVVFGLLAFAIDRAMKKRPKTNDVLKCDEKTGPFPIVAELEVPRHVLLALRSWCGEQFEGCEAPFDYRGVRFKVHSCSLCNLDKCRCCGGTRV